MSFFVPSSQQNFKKTFFAFPKHFPPWEAGLLAPCVSLVNDVTSWAKSCLHCQQSKIHRYTCLLPQPIPIPQWRFAHLHIDLVGPLQYSSDCNHIFTIIDRTSKWMEAIPLSETSGAECACALVFSWITCFGVPKTITSDRGLQFTSNVW